MYSFLRRPAWVGLHIVVLVVVVVFVLLGQWQLRRLDERRIDNAALSAQLALPPTLWPDGSDGIPNEYRRLDVSGSFRQGEEVLLRSQVHLGQPGYDVLTPFYIDEHVAVLINRGWIPLALDAPPIHEASPPTGVVSVTGMVRYPLEGPGTVAMEPGEEPKLLFSRVDLGQIDLQTDGDLLPFYLELEGSGEGAETLPIISEVAEPSDGSHFSYAMQWFAFAAVSITGYVALIRSTARRRSPRSRPAPRRLATW